jgi:hypothetical protein
MRSNVALGIAVAALTVAPWSGLSAQDYTASVGWNAGVIRTTSLNSGASVDTSGDLEPDMAWTVGLHYDRWLWSGIFGIRLNGSFAEQKIDWNQGTRNIYLYMADIDLMLRIVPPRPNRSVSPYISAGVGGIRWALGDGPPTTYTTADATYPGEEKFQLMGMVGAGFDIVTPWSWSDNPIVIRLDGRDHLALESPFEPADPSNDSFDPVHNFRVTLGLHTGIGLLSRR